MNVGERTEALATSHGQRVHTLAWAVALTLWLGARAAQACVGDACMNLWSTAEGGGALSLRYDFSAPVEVYEGFCTANRATCLFSAIEPGFMAPPLDTPPAGLFRIADGTTLRVQLISIEAGLALNVNGNRLSQPGESASLGTMPTIHVHPSWQVVAPGDQAGREYSISFKITTSSDHYVESPPIQARVLAVAAPEDTPTPTPSPTPMACPGDCDRDDVVAADELVTAVALAIGDPGAAPCDAADIDRNSTVSIGEIQMSIDMALHGCPTPARVTLSEIQDSIFTPRCATLFCHDTQGHNGNLILEAGQAFNQLVGVDPDALSARDAGLLRVAPEEPDRSFLLIKLLGPPPSQGSRMPLTGDPLSDEQIDLVRRWILQGALP